MMPYLSLYHHRRLRNRNLKITCQNPFGASFTPAKFLTILLHRAFYLLLSDSCITVFALFATKQRSFFLVTNNICTVKLTMQLSSFSLGTLVQSVFNTHGNLVMIRSSILQEIAAKSSYFSSAETCFNSNTLH